MRRRGARGGRADHLRHLHLQPPRLAAQSCPLGSQAFIDLLLTQLQGDELTTIMCGLLVHSRAKQDELVSEPPVLGYHLPALVAQRQVDSRQPRVLLLHAQQPGSEAVRLQLSAATGVLLEADVTQRQRSDVARAPTVDSAQHLHKPGHRSHRQDQRVEGDVGEVHLQFAVHFLAPWDGARAGTHVPAGRPRQPGAGPLRNPDPMVQTDRVSKRGRFSETRLTNLPS